MRDKVWHVRCYNTTHPSFKASSEVSLNFRMDSQLVFVSGGGAVAKVATRVS